VTQTLSTPRHAGSLVGRKLYSAVLAAVVVTLSQVLGWAGVDVAAQAHRVEAFRTTGFSLWDFQWYGGHWTLDYSVAYPPLASLLGIKALTVISAIGAALAFDALAQRHFPSSGLVASLVFAAGTVVQASIGQLPFLLGEAFALAALWAAIRGVPVAAGALALACSLSSPLAGLFAALAAAAWMIGARDGPGGRRRVAGGAAIVAGAVAPILVSAVLFPGQGPMPYPVLDWAWEVVVAVGILLAAGKSEPVIRWGAALFVGLATLSVIVPSPLGGNVGRLEDVAAVPLAIALLWHRRALVLGVASIPLLLSQWTPAWGAVSKGSAEASTRSSFYAPLDAQLERVAGPHPTGRIEVVPTEFHWESDYVAQVMPLARGWERQLDVADNPMFYDPPTLNAQNYRSWLIDNGVEYVALPDAPLDQAGQAEAKLVGSGTVRSLTEIWSSPDWKLFRVEGSSGIVSGPGRLVSLSGSSVTLDADRAAQMTVRVRYTSDWRVDKGEACISRAAGGWIEVATPRAEEVRLELTLTGAGGPECAASDNHAHGTTRSGVTGESGVTAESGESGVATRSAVATRSGVTVVTPRHGVGSR
jgi:hypothetical protein